MVFLPLFSLQAELSAYHLTTTFSDNQELFWLALKQEVFPTSDGRYSTN